MKSPAPGCAVVTGLPRTRHDVGLFICPHRPKKEKYISRLLPKMCPFNRGPTGAQSWSQCQMNRDSAAHDGQKANQTEKLPFTLQVQVTNFHFIPVSDFLISIRPCLSRCAFSHGCRLGAVSRRGRPSTGHRGTPRPTSVIRSTAVPARLIFFFGRVFFPFQ